MISRRPEDVRNVIAALSDVEPLVEQMFQYRFSQSNDLGGHSLGNLMLTALTEITGDFNHAIAEMSKVLNVHGKVIPAANKRLHYMPNYRMGRTLSASRKFHQAMHRLNGYTWSLVTSNHYLLQFMRLNEQILF